MKISAGNVVDVLRGPVGWVVVGAVVIGVVYFGVGKLFSVIKAPFVAGAALVKDGVNAETQSLTANTDATGNPILDSISVGAAGGG